MADPMGEQMPPVARHVHAALDWAESITGSQCPRKDAVEMALSLIGAGITMIASMESDEATTGKGLLMAYCSQLFDEVRANGQSDGGKG